MRLVAFALILLFSIASCNRGPGEGNDNPEIESEIINESIEEVKMETDSLPIEDTMAR